jgi:hypothetical protein
VQSQPHLLEVVRAFHSGCGITDLLHCRKQQTNQDRNDRDDDEKLDKGKPYPSPGMNHHSPLQIEHEKGTDEQI